MRSRSSASNESNKHSGGSTGGHANKHISGDEVPTPTPTKPSKPATQSSVSEQALLPMAKSNTDFSGLVTGFAQEAKRDQATLAQLLQKHRGANAKQTPPREEEADSESCDANASDESGAVRKKTSLNTA